jgi:hypothetical protein
MDLTACRLIDPRGRRPHRIGRQTSAAPRSRGFPAQFWPPAFEEKLRQWKEFVPRRQKFLTFFFKLSQEYKHSKSSNFLTLAPNLISLMTPSAQK